MRKKITTISECSNLDDKKYYSKSEVALMMCMLVNKCTAEIKSEHPTDYEKNSGCFEAGARILGEIREELFNGSN